MGLKPPTKSDRLVEVASAVPWHIFLMPAKNINQQKITVPFAEAVDGRVAYSSSFTAVSAAGKMAPDFEPPQPCTFCVNIT